MSRKITSFCVVLLLTLTSVSAARRRLKSIGELRDVYWGEHASIVELLRWFANTVDIRNNAIWLPFDPNSGYGSHYYGNHQDLLEPQPCGFKYYTVGNILKNKSESLPSCVRDSQRWTNRRNRARIIFSANSSRQINRVFITQHYGSSDDSSYDSDNTYEVTVNLLQEFRRQYYTDGQRGSYGNMSHVKEQAYFNQHRYTSQPHARNNELDCLSTFCIALVVFIVIIFALIVNSAAKGK